MQEIAKPVAVSTRCRQIYRYREATYMSGGAIVTKTEWRKVSKLSCRCRQCNHGPLEEAREAGPVLVEIRCDVPENGALYTAHCVVTGTNWENGNAEEWYWQMTKFVSGTGEA